MDSSFVLALLFISIRLTIFFRRTFDVAGNKVFHIINCSWISIYFLLLPVVAYYKYTEWLQTVCEWLLLAFVIYSLYVHSLSKEKMGKSFFLFITLHVSISESISIAALCWISTCVIATTRLLRWPSFVKLYLRKVRTILGPSYTILFIGACYKEHRYLSINNYKHSVGAEDTNTRYNVHYYLFMKFVFTPSLLKVAFLSSFIASILYRIDNNSIWTVFVTPFSKQKR